MPILISINGDLDGKSFEYFLNGYFDIGQICSKNVFAVHLVGQCLPKYIYYFFLKISDHDLAFFES